MNEPLYVNNIQELQCVAIFYIVFLHIQYLPDMYKAQNKCMLWKERSDICY